MAIESPTQSMIPAMPPTLRRLTPADALPYRALMLQAYAAHPEAFTSSVREREALPLARWEARLCPDGDAAEVVLGAWASMADDAGAATPVLAGVVGLAFEQRDKIRHKANLFGMAVAPEYRRCGLGSLLVAHALQMAKARAGVRVVQLTVTEGNTAAVDLYTRHGFVQFGLEPMAVAVDGGYVRKCHMWLDLWLEVTPGSAPDSGA